MKVNLLKVLHYIVWFFIGISVIIMLYSFTQPKMGMKLTLVALVTCGIGFGVNMLLKKKQQDEEENEEE